MRKVAIGVFGITGGRHCQMSGLAETTIRAYEKAGYEFIAFFGFSGGAIVSALMSSGIYKSEDGIQRWIESSSDYGKHGRIGSWSLPCNIWNLLRHGGLLNSASLYNKVFAKMFNDMDFKVPAFAGSWCTSHNVEILRDLTKGDAASAILCSAALPFAISPMKVLNKDLLDLGYGDLLPGIKDDLDGFSYFSDGGTSSALGVGVVDNTDLVASLTQELGHPIPVIGINIDPINPGHDSGFGKYSWHKKIWESGWGVVRANIRKDIEEARRETKLQLCVAPTPKHLMKFSTKFDATIKENLALYNTGCRQAEDWLSTPVDGYENPVAALDAWYEQQWEK